MHRSGSRSTDDDIFEVVEGLGRDPEDNTNVVERVEAANGLPSIDNSQREVPGHIGQLRKHGSRHVVNVNQTAIVEFTRQIRTTDPQLVGQLGLIERNLPRGIP